MQKTVNVKFFKAKEYINNIAWIEITPGELGVRKAKKYSTSSRKYSSDMKDIA